MTFVGARPSHVFKYCAREGRGTGPWTSREGVGDDVYNNFSDANSGYEYFREYISSVFPRFVRIFSRCNYAMHGIFFLWNGMVDRTTVQFWRFGIIVYDIW